MVASKYQFNLIDSTTRRQHILQRAAEARTSYRLKREVKFRGGREMLPIIEMPIDHLLYRLENFRTLSDQFSRIASGKVNDGFFNPSHREDVSAQSVQHDILFLLAQKGSGESIKPIYDELERVKEQADELLISSDGVVVNGNRRLAAMRELWASGGPDFSRFSNVTCAVLPESTSDDEILTLEIELQMQPDTKLPYDWTSVALAARELQKRCHADDWIARLMNREVEEIRRLIKMIDGADLYLSDHLRKPRAYDALEQTEQAFSQIATRNLAKTDNPTLREITRKFDFLLIENREQIELRAYELINNIEANPEIFLDNMAATWNLDLAAAPSNPPPQFKISFEDTAAASLGKDYSTLVQYLDNLGDDKTVRSAAARTVEEVSVLAGEQGKRKDLAALKFAKAAQQKLNAINLRYTNNTTFVELRTVLASCMTQCQALIDDINTRLRGH
jgi:hypothetical protein